MECQLIKILLKEVKLLKMLFYKSIPNKSGIYCIACEDGRLYIGQSKFMKKRISEHIWDLRKNKHANSYMQKLWNKYKETYFQVRVLIFCENYELNYYEGAFLNFISEEKRLNLGAVGGVIPVSETTKQKKKLIAIRGEKNPASKMTNSQIYDMRIQYMDGATTKELAKKYNVSLSFIIHAVQGRKRGEVPFPPNFKLRSSKKLNFEQVKEIKILHTEGNSIKELTARFNVSRMTIKSIIDNKAWRKVNH